MLLTRFKELQNTLEQCFCCTDQGVTTADEALQYFYDFLLQTKEAGGIVYVIGNGGSAGIASHFCNDLMKAVQIPAQTLYDSNIMSCFSNDYGYEFVFSGPLNTLLKQNDLLVAISSSGKSPNILNAVACAKEKGARIITLSGFATDNPLKDLGDLNFWLPISDYGLVESGHFFLLHTVIDLWKTLKSLSSVNSYANQN